MNRPRPLAACLAAMLVACAAAAAPASARTVWLCKPGLRDNPCLEPLTATVVGTNGPSGVQRSRRARRPAIDCFYVYPTVSGQPTVNANRDIDPEQRAVARQQVSRFSQVCRPFAPMYRQVTIAGLLRPPDDPAAAVRRAHADVRAAWRQYLRRHNRGRGVVLLGHSQGTYMLRDLIKEEIDPRPRLRRRLVSAVLLGGDVLVRKGRPDGGDFRHIEACRAPRQTGCVIAYSAFDDLPAPDALFGRGLTPFPGAGSDSPNLEVLCTNPASLHGGSGALEPYFRTRRFPGLLGDVADPPPAANTPWVTMPRLYSARCRREDGAVWLHVRSASGDPRRTVNPTLGPGWGLHLYDVNLALGNLVDVVRRQAAAYRRALR